MLSAVPDYINFRVINRRAWTPDELAFITVVQRRINGWSQGDCGEVFIGDPHHVIRPPGDHMQP